MKTISVTCNGVAFDAAFSETTTAENVDKTLAIPVTDQSAASFEELPDESGFYFEGESNVSGEYVLAEKAPAHYIFTNK